MPQLHPPQIMKGAHAIYMVWRAADPGAAVATVPRQLQPAKNGIVFLNQYVVERAEQTSSADHPAGFGAYSLTYAGVDLAGFGTKDQGEAGISPDRWWVHYINSSCEHARPGRWSADQARRASMPSSLRFPNFSTEWTSANWRRAGPLFA